MVLEQNKEEAGFTVQTRVSGIVNVTSHRKWEQEERNFFAFSEDFILAWGDGDLESKVNWAGGTAHLEIDLQFFHDLS